jgi:DHA3 family macrolide efflux protein-like MFS transporter
MFSVGLVAVGIVGFSLPIVNGSIGAIMQSSVAPDMQGRVFSLVSSLSGTMAPIGLAIAGPISDIIGIQSWFRIAGIFCIGMGLVGYMIPAVSNIESNNPNKKPEIEDKIKSEGLGGSLPEATAYSDSER